MEATKAETAAKRLETFYGSKRAAATALLRAAEHGLHGQEWRHMGAVARAFMEQLKGRRWVEPRSGAVFFDDDSVAWAVVGEGPDGDIQMGTGSDNWFSFRELFEAPKRLEEKGDWPSEAG